MRKLAIVVLLLLPVATATNAVVNRGSVTNLGSINLTTDFGMLVGTIKFSLGSYSWVPKEIYLVPVNTTADEFFQNASLVAYLEIPENLTFSTCRTVVYRNEHYGYGFKIYNTQTKTQILTNGTFCGLAYEGTYSVFASY